MPAPSRTFRIDLGYDGSGFVGSQRQPGARTVQGVVEAALARLAGSPIRLTLAGRTDRGVHAVGQVGSARLGWRGTEQELRRALQALTPDDVAIYAVREVPPGFHARFDAWSREYRYRVWEGTEHPVLLRHLVWPVRAELDLGRMDAAARCLIGQHDFAAVAGAGRGVPGAEADTVRTVTLADWRVVPQPFAPPDRGGRLLEFRIAADGFLPHMVRNIVGDLVLIGRGSQPVEWLEALLSAGDRRRGAAPAPPQGLVLWRVMYADDELDGVEMDTDAEGNAGDWLKGDEDLLAKGI